MRESLATVGAAVVATTGIVVTGFSILTVSHFELNVSFGLMTATTILAALACDLLLLPALLVVADRDRVD